MKRVKKKKIFGSPKNRTVIMIAHRFSTLKDCNRIVQLDGGVMEEKKTKNLIF